MPPTGGGVIFSNGDDFAIGPTCKANYLGANHTVASMTYLNTCNAAFNTSFNSTGGGGGGGTMYIFPFISGNTGIPIDLGDGFAHTLGNTANSGVSAVVLAGDLTVTYNVCVIRNLRQHL